MTTDAINVTAQVKLANLSVRLSSGVNSESLAVARLSVAAFAQAACAAGSPDVKLSLARLNVQDGTVFIHHGTLSGAVKLFADDAPMQLNVSGEDATSILLPLAMAATVRRVRQTVTESERKGVEDH